MQLSPKVIQAALLMGYERDFSEVLTNNLLIDLKI